jgi:predicted metal-dependent phosphoesterase TrpH
MGKIKESGMDAVAITDHGCSMVQQILEECKRIWYQTHYRV